MLITHSNTLHRYAALSDTPLNAQLRYPTTAAIASANAREPHSATAARFLLTLVL